MLFVISGKVTRDASLSCHVLAKEFEKEIVTLLSDVEVQSPLDCVLLFPTILDPDIALMPDASSYKKGIKAMYVSRNLSYREWMKSSDSERINLLAENISSSVRSIESSYLFPEDKERFLDWIEKARLIIRERIKSK